MQSRFLVLSFFLWISSLFAGELIFLQTPIAGQKTKFLYQTDQENIVLFINEQQQEIEKVAEGFEGFLNLPSHTTQISYHTATENGILEIHPMPLFWSIVPPVLAIVMAIVLKEVLSALLIAIFSGLMILGYYKNNFWGVLESVPQLVLNYIPESMADKNHISVMLFCLLTSAMITLVSKNGGMQGMVDKISRYAKGPISVQLTTFILGVVMFFDDYANSLVVGSTMKKITDRLGVSREKLAYLVDSTAAPISAIALITTWIGGVLQYIQDGLTHLQTEGEVLNNKSAYGIFLDSLQYSFYPIYTLFFILGIILLNRDFGPMYQKEKNARTGKTEKNLNSVEENDTYSPLKGVKIRAFNGYIPILTLIGVTVFYLFLTGSQSSGAFADPSLSFYQKIQNTIGAADSFAAILMGAFVALIVAFFLTLSQRLLSLSQSMHYITVGMKYIVSTLMILILAWTIAAVTQQMHTADFLVQITQNNISPQWLPALTFVLAGITAFATGTSWGTMAILYPIILPLTWQMGMNQNLSTEMLEPIFLSCIASVLAGAVFGDHCSPISDTTILSSLATSCDHLEHIKTQMPYALIVAGVSLVFGIIPAAYGFSSLWLMPIGVFVLWGIIFFFGKKLYF